MLVLSRHVSEAIVIRVGNETIRLIVVDIRGDKVRIGAEAAEHVAIDRQEVYESKQRNQPRNCA